MENMGIIGGADGSTAVLVSGGGFCGTLENFEGWMLAVAALCVLAAYLLGNISPAIILGRMSGIDIKKEGSGNAGTTNVLRVLGKKAALITLVIDIGKGVVAVLLGRFAGFWLDAQMGASFEIARAETAQVIFMSSLLPMLCALCVLMGHVWPMIFKFKGGKGVATAFGALVSICPPIGLFALLIVAVVVVLTRRVSPGSICGALSVPFLAYAFMPEFTGIACLMALIVIVKHRSNIVRIFKGEEPKLSFKK